VSWLALLSLSPEGLRSSGWCRNNRRLPCVPALRPRWICRPVDASRSSPRITRATPAHVVRRYRELVGPLPRRSRSRRSPHWAAAPGLAARAVRPERILPGRDHHPHPAIRRSGESAGPTSSGIRSLDSFPTPDCPLYLLPRTLAGIDHVLRRQIHECTLVQLGTIALPPWGRCTNSCGRSEVRLEAQPVEVAKQRVLVGELQRPRCGPRAAAAPVLRARVPAPTRITALTTCPR
jgi:hypothetical protein